MEVGWPAWEERPLLPGFHQSARFTRQAVARPSEVDDGRQTTANAESSTCRSATVWSAADQLAVSEHHFYDI
jgi:hypothetical protein